MTVTGAKPMGAENEAHAAEAVQQMFNAIAPRYDLLNHVLSANVDRLWWSRTASKFRGVLADPNAAVLDICCGTGDLTMALLRHRGSEARPILAADFAHGMLLRGAQKFSQPRSNRSRAVALEADALHLPLRSESLDLIVTSFGFRNLEFSEPGGLIGKIYALYFRRILPAIGRIICGNDGPYSYLPASVGAFPQPAEMLAMMRSSGYSSCEWKPYTFGIAGLYTAVRPTVL